MALAEEELELKAVSNPASAWLSAAVVWLAWLLVAAVTLASVSDIGPAAAPWGSQAEAKPESGPVSALVERQVAVQRAAPEFHNTDAACTNQRR